MEGTRRSLLERQSEALGRNEEEDETDLPTSVTASAENRNMEEEQEGIEDEESKGKAQVKEYSVEMVDTNDPVNEKRKRNVVF